MVFFVYLYLPLQSYKNVIMSFNLYRTELKRIFIAGLVIFCISLIAVREVSAQRGKSEAPPLRDRFFFGGSFGLQLGTFTNIEASPIVGFWVLPRLAVAVGPDYSFYKDPGDKTSIYGGRGYTEIVVVKDFNSIIPLGINLGLFLHLEDEFLSLESEFWKLPPYESNRFTVNTFLAGGGISQPVGLRGSINMMVLWALNESVYDIYGNPEFRVSFTF